MSDVITVRHLMSCDVHKVSPTAPVEFVLELLVSQDWQDIYVVDDQDEVQGIVPDYTLFKCWMHQQQLKSPVVKVMSSQFSTLSPEVSVDKIAPLYREAMNDRIAVVDCGRLLGQLYRQDVITFLLTQAEHLSREDHCAVEEADVDQESKAPSAKIGAPNFAKTRTRSRRTVGF